MNVTTLENAESNIIFEADSLQYALEQLGEISVKVLLVVNDTNIFVGTITDGDVRRAILAGASLETMVSHIANYDPLFLEHDDEDIARKLMYERKISALPILNEEKKIQKVYIVGEERQKEDNEKLDVPVVIMAGGLGTRLYPYTKILPKPLIPVSDIPISERIIQSFQKIGCEEFHMVVNYKRNMIKAYFNDMDHGLSLIHI